MKKLKTSLHFLTLINCGSKIFYLMSRKKLKIEKLVGFSMIFMSKIKPFLYPLIWIYIQNPDLDPASPLMRIRIRIQKPDFRPHKSIRIGISISQ
jgi:hypothetical protein